MEIYFILLFWSLFSSVLFLFSVKTKIKKMLYLCFNFIPMALVSGIRSSSVGTDTKMYHYLFNLFSTQEIQLSFYSDDLIEIGYVALNKFIGLLTDDSQIFIFFISFLTMILFSYFLYKNSCNVCLSTFLFIGMFFFCETLNTVRQSLATAILCCGYHFLLENKKRIYSIFVAFATSIHFSSVIFFFFLYLFPIDREKTYKYILILFLVFLMTSYTINNFGSNFLFQFDFSGKYAGGYSESLYAKPKEFGAGIYRVIVFISLVSICLFFDFKNKYNGCEKKHIYILSVFLIIASLFTLGQYQILLFYRLIFYFSIYACLLIPLLLKKMGKLKYPIYFFLFASTIAFLSRMLFLKEDSVHLIYNTCF